MGLAATLGTIVIHGFVVHTVVMTVRRNLQRGVLGMRIWVNLAFGAASTSVSIVVRNLKHHPAATAAQARPIAHHHPRRLHDQRRVKR